MRKASSVTAKRIDMNTVSVCFLLAVEPELQGHRSKVNRLDTVQLTLGFLLELYSTVQ